MAQQNGFARRQALAALGAGAGLAIAAACAPAASGPAPKAEDKPRPGGKLKAVRNDQPVNLDAHEVSIGTLSTLNNVHDRLLVYDNQLNANPMLAESYDLATNGKALKLNIRKGVTFHTGREFTADDVKWNVEKGKDPKVGSGNWASFYPWIKSIETPDKYTVIFNMDPARPALLDMFGAMNMRDKDTAADPKKAVGTGPFVFVEWNSGKDMQFTKNKSYWRAERPYLDAWEMNFTGDLQAAAVRLEAGDVGVLVDPTIRDAARLSADASGKWGIITVQVQYITLIVNPDKHPALKEKRVRQALSMAIDRKRIVETVLLKQAEVWNLPWPSYSEAYEPQKNATTQFDLDKARSLITAAGATNAELEVVYRNIDAELSQMGQLMQADFAKIGIKLKLTGLESAAASARTATKDYHLNLGTGAFAQYHPAARLGRGSPPPFTGPYNQALVNEALGEPDLAKRKALYSRINDLILDESIDIVISSLPRQTVYNKEKVAGIQRGLVNATLYADAWLKG